MIDKSRLEIAYALRYNIYMASIYCSNCGRLITEESNFCRYCGAAQHGIAAAAYRANAPVIKHAIGASAILQSQQDEVVQVKGSKEIKYLTGQHLAPAVRFSFMISYMRISSVLILLMATGLFFDPLLFGSIFGVYLIFLYLFSSLAYNNFIYSVDESGFIKEYGVISKSQSAIPYDRIQNVNITRGLADRLLGLARIDIETAGTSSSKVKDIIGGSYSSAEGHLPGLTLKQAKKVHDILLHNTARVSSGGL